MRRIYLFIVVVFGMATVALAQTTSSDSQTLQALLGEVRQLRQDLQVSLTRMQSAQILLSRLQIQEVAVTRASQHLDDARSKLSEVQVVMKSEAAEIKHFEDAPNNGDNAAQVEAALNRAKSDLEASTNLAQQRQSTETDAELQLRTEQDKLNRFESQLDELLRNLENSGQQSGRVPQ
jgi:isoleucyl-tRNA synthetase